MSNKKEVLGVWSVNNFPLSLKNKFAGKAKEKGMNIGDLLEIVVKRYLKQEELK